MQSDRGVFIGLTSSYGDRECGGGRGGGPKGGGVRGGEGGLKGREGNKDDGE